MGPPGSTPPACIGPLVYRGGPDTGPPVYRGGPDQRERGSRGGSGTASSSSSSRSCIVTAGRSGMRGLLRPGVCSGPAGPGPTSVRPVTYILDGHHRTTWLGGTARTAEAAERLPATELASCGPEGGEARHDRQAYGGGQEAAGGTAGGPAAARAGEAAGQAEHDVGRPGHGQQDQGGADRV